MTDVSVSGRRVVLYPFLVVVVLMAAGVATYLVALARGLREEKRQLALRRPGYG